MICLSLLGQCAHAFWTGSQPFYKQAKVILRYATRVGYPLRVARSLATGSVVVACSALCSIFDVVSMPAHKKSANHSSFDGPIE